MKKNLLFIGLILGPALLFSQAQDWSWAQSINGTADENSNHMAIDNSGNLLVTGKFSSPTISLSATTLTNTGASNTSDALIAKYNSAGTLLWAKRAQGLDNDEGIAITSDGSGNIYVAGNYESPTIVFGTITLSNTSTSSEIFLVKYDGSGSVLWAKTFGGNLLDEVRSLKADNSGNTYMVGTFRSLAVQFGAYGVINAGNSDAFITKIDVNGVPQWAKQVGGAQNDNGLSVTHDGSGNIYMGGEFNSPNLTSYNLTNAGAMDMFFSKYDAAGNLILTKAVGGTLNETVNYMVTDASGNLYVAGSYESSALSLGSVTLTNGSTKDIALFKMNSSLVVQWGKRASGNLSTYPSALFIDQSANLFMAGMFNLSTLNFGSNSLTNASTATEGFIAKYDLSGTDLWAKGTNAASDQEIKGIVVDNLGSIYVTGNYTSTLTLGPTALSNGGSEDLFLAKICVQPLPPTAVVANVTVCPKKTGTLSVTVPTGAVADWYSTATGGSTLLAGSNTFTAASTSTFYVQSNNLTTGCVNPNRVAITLSVQPGSSVTVSGKTLTATSGTSYQWIECVKDSVMQGQTGQTLVISKSGNFAVIVTNNGCVDTSACKFYSVTASGTITVPGDSTIVSLQKNTDVQRYLTVFPNPNNGNFTIKATQVGHVVIVNILGQPVRKLQFNSENNYTELVADLENGVYFLSGDIATRQRIIVSR